MVQVVGNIAILLGIALLAFAWLHERRERKQEAALAKSLVESFNELNTHFAALRQVNSQQNTLIATMTRQIYDNRNKELPADLALLLFKYLCHDTRWEIARAIALETEAESEARIALGAFFETTPAETPEHFDHLFDVEFPSPALAKLEARRLELFTAVAERNNPPQHRP